MKQLIIWKQVLMVVKEIKKAKYGYNVLAGEQKIYIETKVFLKYRLKKGQTLEINLWNKILEDNEKELIKRKSLVFLARRRSTSEFIAYLKKLKAPEYLISLLVKDYTKKGYLDDYLYAELLINKEQQRYGKIRLEKILLDKGINKKIINSLLENHLDKNLESLIEKACKTVKADNYSMAREKLLRSFTRKGYNLKEISQYLETYLDKDSFNEDITIKKHYLKAFNKFQNKYTGDELNLKVKQALYRKGYKMDLIDKVIRGD